MSSYSPIRIIQRQSYISEKKIIYIDFNNFKLYFNTVIERYSKFL